METKNPKSSTHLSFNLINPYAVAYARTHLSENLGPLKERGQEIIRDYVARAVGGEFSPQQIARVIRDKALALTSEQTVASDAYWKDLIKKGLDANTINRRVAKFNARQLQDRAETIALTEIHRAAQAGTIASWQAAANQGLIDPSEWVKVWHVTWDDRLCPICEPMDGVAVGLFDNFTVNTDGKAIDNGFEKSTEIAAAHPRCRCTITRVRADQLDAWRERLNRPEEKPQSHRP